MSAHGSAENTPNTPEFVCPICFLKAKGSGFQWKNASLGVRSPWLVVFTLNKVWIMESMYLNFDHNMPRYFFYL